jgi:hypothetical protein
MAGSVDSGGCEGLRAGAAKTQRRRVSTNKTALVEKGDQATVAQAGEPITFPIMRPAELRNYLHGALYTVQDVVRRVSVLRRECPARNAHPGLRGAGGAGGAGSAGAHRLQVLCTEYVVRTGSL